AERTTDSSATGHSSSSDTSVAGNVIGAIASSATGSIGGQLNYVPVAEFTDVISASIACKLEPKEQKQAADATLEATRSAGDDDGAAPEVGQMAMWTSETRPDVSGTSTVTASDQAVNDDGLQCLM